MSAGRLDRMLAHSRGAGFNLFCIAAALITYMSMYAFRKPLSAATFEGLSYWGMDYKIIALISQVAGYTCSKFLGIRVVSSMRPSRRTACILGFVGFAWVALLLFALVPRPWNVVFLVANGLPLGMIFGIVISFLEGRRNTELLGAGLCVSFITASGITKAVGRWLILQFGVSDFWMPFLTGLVFVPFLLLGVWMLGKIPPPTAEDCALRSRRSPMDGAARRRFVRAFSWGVVLSVLTYATLTVYRDLRDNFVVELWEQLGFGGDASVLAVSEMCVAVFVLAIVASMVRVVDNRKAFFGNIFIFLGGGLCLAASTVLFRLGMLPAFAWMVVSGFGLYLCYACFHTMFFERWIAVFRYKSNISFMICMSDSFGYLGSVCVLVGKNFFTPEVDWLAFITTAACISGAVIAACSLLLYVYFARKVRRGQSVAVGWPGAAAGSDAVQPCPLLF